MQAPPESPAASTNRRCRASEGGRSAANPSPASAGFRRGRFLAFARFYRRGTRATGERGGSPTKRAFRAAIEGELATARGEVEVQQRRVEAAEAARAAAAAAEAEARAQWRGAQHATDAAREEHAAAEREISRNASRISALNEAKQRTGAGRDEAVAACRDAQKALAELPDASRSLKPDLPGSTKRSQGIAERLPKYASRPRPPPAMPSWRIAGCTRSQPSGPTGSSGRKKAAAQIATIEERSLRRPRVSAAS